MLTEIATYCFSYWINIILSDEFMLENRSVWILLEGLCSTVTLEDHLAPVILEMSTCYDPVEERCKRLLPEVLFVQEALNMPKSPPLEE